MSVSELTAEMLDELERLSSGMREGYTMQAMACEIELTGQLLEHAPALIAAARRAERLHQIAFHADGLLRGLSEAKTDIPYDAIEAWECLGEVLVKEFGGESVPCRCGPGCQARADRAALTENPSQSRRAAPQRPLAGGDVAQGG